MSLPTPAAVKEPRADAARVITSHRLEFNVPADTPRYWFDDDPYLTHVMNALSLMIPEGERAVATTLHELCQQLNDPVLVQQVRGLVAQESLHRHLHDRLNCWLRTLGVDVDRHYAGMKAFVKADRPTASARTRAAAACALEHITAIWATHWLTHEDVRMRAHPSVRPLCTWHALEEVEHKGVALDVYRALGGSYLRRVLVMLAVTYAVVHKQSSLQVRLMLWDKQYTPRVWLRGFWRVWTPPGGYLALVPAYLRYFKPGFDPWERDETALVERFARELNLI